MAVETKGALRPRDVAEWLSCSDDTVARLIASGDLASFKIGAGRFVSVAELERFVRAREEAADR